MTQLALLDHHPAHRHLRMLGANLVFSTPFVGELAEGRQHPRLRTRCGAPALQRRTGRGLARGLQGHRQALQRALQTAAVRSRRFRRRCAAHEDTDRPVRHRRRRGDLPDHREFQGHRPHAGRAVLPLTPTFPWLGPLGLIPMPSKWIIEFGEPIRTDDFPDGAADDPMLVFNLTDQGAREHPADAVPATGATALRLPVGPQSAVAGLCETSGCGSQPRRSRHRIGRAHAGRARHHLR